MYFHGRKHGHRKNTIGWEGVGRHLSKYKPTTVTVRVESFDINTLTSFFVMCVSIRRGIGRKDTSDT